MGLISLEGMVFFAHHGYYHKEQENGNKFIVDLKLETDLSKAAETDDLSNALNYEEVYRVVKEQMAIRSDLLEHVASRIMDSLRSKFPQILSIEVKIAKANPPVKGMVDRVCVIMRDGKNS